MTSNLPERQDWTPDLLGGQATLFDDPTKLLTWEESVLRNIAANLGREGGSLIAQLRRAAGLVAWAAWYRFPEATYREFAAGLASSLGIEVETLRKWRRSVVSAEKLPVPGVAGQRADAAAKGRKTAGQPGGAVRTSATSKPIPAASTEAPATEVSEGRTPEADPAESWGEGGSTPPVATGTRLPLADPSSGGAGIQPPPRPTGEPTSPLPAPPGPPERPPSDRQLAARVVTAMQSVDPTDAGPVLTPEEATFLRQWAQRTLDAWKAVYAPPAPAEKPQRRQGTLPSRPLARTPAEVHVNGRGKRHADDCSCLSCVAPKAVSK